MRKLAAVLLVLACSKPTTQPDVTLGGKAQARVVVMTQALVTKESGPKESLAAFGESYAFVPSTFAVRQNEPTEIIFWNLQGDDEHDVMLLDSARHVVLQAKLPPLKKTSFVMTFHRAGLFDLYCTMHQPEMSGQVVVTPQPARR
jgi:plastocyanin